LTQPFLSFLLKNIEKSTDCLGERNFHFFISELYLFIHLIEFNLNDNLKITSMKRKIFTFLLSAFLCNMLLAQAPAAVIKKTPVAPVIDGVVDPIWFGANTYNIAVATDNGIPTLGPEGTTTWKALWNDDGIFILLTVNDDVWYPSYKTGGNSWQYDKPEIYFDVNTNKLDGVGPVTSGSGHYQVAPAATEDGIFGTNVADGDGEHAFMVTEPTYLAEYFVPFSKLKDKDGAAIDLAAPMGFDVTIIDRDDVTPSELFAVWSSGGAWNNMDNAGTVTFSQEVAVAGTIIKKASVAPVIDGVIDAVWESANTYNIEKPFQTETPTLGDAGTTFWKGLWTEEGIYLLLKVNDNEFYPSYMNNSSENWMYDKPEIYFDVNAEKKDGLGSKDSKGHYQVAPGFVEGELDGKLKEDGDGAHAFKVTDPTYVNEYFIPFSKLLDKDGVEMDKSAPFAFDVTIIDGESAAPGTRQRANWSNDGTGPAATESWANMDDCGLVILDGAAEAIMVDNITISGGTTITSDNGTLQMVASVEPADATAQKVKWSVESITGVAAISKEGLLTAQKDGTVYVKAMAQDGSFVEGRVTVTISGQLIDSNDLWVNFNQIKNGLYDQGSAGLDGWSGWVDTAGAPGSANPVVVDGVCEMQCGIGAYNWQYQHTQTSMTCEPNVPYIFKFKSWASADNTPGVVIFEDSPANNWARYGASYDADAQGGRSEWHYNIMMEPTWFIYHVTFDQLQETTPQKLYWALALSNEKIYQDSVMLIKEADLLLSAPVLAKSKIQLYPNPVQTELTVKNIAANSKVSVYNAVGQKLIEKTANGTQAKFDVANLRKGMYFVRFSDGTSEKFIKQ
jgi:hypothetical protein